LLLLLLLLLLFRVVVVVVVNVRTLKQQQQQQQHYTEFSRPCLGMILNTTGAGARLAFVVLLNHVPLHFGLNVVVVVVDVLRCIYKHV
jgi:hypothetical protein